LAGFCDLQLPEPLLRVPGWGGQHHVRDQERCALLQHQCRLLDYKTHGFLAFSYSSVTDRKFFISDPDLDPACQVITDPDQNFQVGTNPDTVRIFFVKVSQDTLYVEMNKK